ncbi:hypothetical protein [Streptococcus sp. sy004]
MVDNRIKLRPVSLSICLGMAWLFKIRRKLWLR